MKRTFFRRHFGLLFALFTVLILIQCQKDKNNIPPTPTDVIFLGHKGGGDNSVNTSNIENTLTAVEAGVKILSGIELDIQMSLDGTIWVYHDPAVTRYTCSNFGSPSIILSKDTQLSKILICNGNNKDRLYKLSEIINHWNSATTPYYISLHVTLDFPKDTINNSKIGGEALYLAKMADQFAKVIQSVKSPGKIIIEVYDATFCNRIHSLIPGIKVCLIKDVDFPTQVQHAIAQGYDGVSSFFDVPSITASEVANAKGKGLIVQFWAPYSKTELSKTLSYHPTTIQTDNLDALSQLNLTVVLP